MLMDMHSRLSFSHVFVSVLLATGIACSSSSNTAADATASHDAPTSVDGPFEITDHSDSGFEALPKKTSVFEIPIYAAAGVEDAKLLHAAVVMAQYLDNDEDGVADHPLVVAKMREVSAFLVMWKTESDLNIEIPDGIGQDLGADETVPGWHENHTGRFDASLEEVLHLITHAGYAQLYPEVFGEAAGSQIANAMDIARGGHFTSIPDSYPVNAWYSYDDQTCDYSCMISEYHYWALTSLLGAQAQRLDEIAQEWKLNTPDKVSSTDTGVHALLTAPEYSFATVLPDAEYLPQ